MESTMDPIFWVLVGLSFLGSFISASVGIGGGTLLIAVMANLLPPQVLIPVHGWVQLGSNANRAWMLRKHVDWPVIRWFLLGLIPGAALGVGLSLALPVSWLQIVLAGFILYLSWGPKLAMAKLPGWGVSVGAAVTTFLSFLVGATGPLVAAFIQKRYLERQVAVATFSSAMVLQHLSKGVGFELGGFSLQAWLPLIMAMIAAGALGTWMGLRLLLKMNNERFQFLFRAAITLLALRLLWQGIGGL
ncbi:sulfite exporter TauE/SafE family protein [Pokkaliibacter sp. CJK22405]|uniref:sulfite exporter TauE/SafE family protein n=1 Tax=Pokkaliibacter sp. CJK22405 TaxID=3384615 RepID=UPI003984743B